MAKMLGITCNDCGRTLLDNGDKCNHCGRYLDARQLNAQKWYKLAKNEILSHIELSSNPVNFLVKCNFFSDYFPGISFRDFLYNTTFHRYFIRAPIAKRLSIFAVKNVQIFL